MKNEVMVFNNEEFGDLRTILNEDGSISVNAEDAAIGLGWIQTQTKNGKRYISIRWETLNMHCNGFGFPNKLGKDDYIPESLFYLLAMKANNERAQKFQKWVAIDVIPHIRKTGMYHMPQTTDEKISLLAQGHSEVIQRLESQQKEIDTIKERLNIIGFADNEWMLKKLQSATKAKVLRMTENPTYRVLWSRYFFGGIYKSVKDHFRVASLKSIPANSLDSALEIINAWYPTDIFLQNRIISMKAHQEKNLLPDKKVIALLQYLKETKDGEINPFDQIS
nr:MAG TPA: antirepressor [Caudoviricetes sp.]